jgi:putative spermidine/putrescine transport system permease protein
MGTAGIEIAETGAGPGARDRRIPLAWVGTVPFFAYVGVFLLLPTGIVVWGAIFRDGSFDFASLKIFADETVRGYFWHSIQLSGLSASIGALLGAVLAYAIALGNPNGFVRKASIAGSGVLAQFGGVTLAFAFSAAIGPASGFLFHASWYYDFPLGIMLIYVYFQIPLMVLIFLPAISGIRPQWREATESLGGSSWDYWRHVGVPLLLPSFLGCTLLLFANALSAYATIQAWENQIPYVVPQKVSLSLSSEVGLASKNEAQVLALGMVIMVALIMTGYTLLQRRTTRWLR